MIKNGCSKINILLFALYISFGHASSQDRITADPYLSEARICLLPFTLRLKIEPNIEEVINEGEKFCERCLFDLRLRIFNEEIETREDILSFLSIVTPDTNDIHLIRARVVLHYQDFSNYDVLLLDHKGFIYFENKWFENKQLVSLLLSDFVETSTGWR